MSFIKPTIIPFAAAGAASLSVTGLDLNTDLMYEIYFKTTKATGLSGLSVRFNSDNGADHSYTTWNNDYTNSTGSSGATGQTSITPAVATYKSWSGRILLTLQDDGRPSVQFNITGADDGTASHLISIFGSGFKDWTTNVTSLQLLLNAVTCDWVAKLRPIKFF